MDFKAVNLKATLETKTSKKNEPYVCIVITGFPEDYEKVVFLDNAELALLKSIKVDEVVRNPFELN